MLYFMIAFTSYIENIFQRINMLKIYGPTLEHNIFREVENGRAENVQKMTHDLRLTNPADGKHRSHHSI